MGLVVLSINFKTILDFLKSKFDIKDNFPKRHIIIFIFIFLFYLAALDFQNSNTS